MTSQGRWSTLNRTLVNIEQTAALGLHIVIMAVPRESPFGVYLSDEQAKNENRNWLRFTNSDPYGLVTRHF